MEGFSLDKKNIFMKFRFPDGSKENIIFFYSNENGFEHLTKVLNDNPLFSNLLTPEEILTKMSYEMAWQFSYNQYTGVNSSKWSGKNLLIFEEQKEVFDETFLVWKKQMESFMGKENLFEVHMPEMELKKYVDYIKEHKLSDNGEILIEFIEKYRLGLLLDDELGISNKSKVKNKI